MLIAALPHVLLTLFIWEGRVSDALLAVKLPAVLLAALGVGYALDHLSRGFRRLGALPVLALAGVILALYISHRPTVLAITRDRGTEAVVRAAAAVPPSVGRGTTLMALWGHDYWALAYAQAYEGRLSNLTLVDHNIDLRAVSQRGDRLITLDKTLYHCPLAWWEETLGPVRLDYVAPGILEIGSGSLDEQDEVPPGATMALGNGIQIASAWVSHDEAGQPQLTVIWQALEAIRGDYAVAVHLLAHDPPAGPQDILAQADRSHPVGGWYPTSRWSQGEVVKDIYTLARPTGGTPVAVRVGMYQVDPQGQFVNTEWLSISVGS